MPAPYDLSVIKARRAILHCNQLGIGHSWHCGARWYSENIRWAGLNLYILLMISERVSEVNFDKPVTVPMYPFAARVCTFRIVDSLYELFNINSKLKGCMSL